MLQWIDCDCSTVRRRYDRIAPYLPFFERVFFVPPDLRADAVARLALRPGDSVLDIGCGTGSNFPYLHDAVGPLGSIYGVDISPGMLRQARHLRDRRQWNNIALVECDFADFKSPEPLDAVLFSLSYCTMPHHRAVLRRAWQQLGPDGRLVIMDAKVPPWGRKLILPFSMWLMKHTMLGNPLIRPWEEINAIADQTHMQEFLFGSYYICHATKPVVTSVPKPAALPESQRAFAMAAAG